MRLSAFATRRRDIYHDFSIYSFVISGVSRTRVELAHRCRWCRDLGFPAIAAFGPLAIRSNTSNVGEEIAKTQV
jgi:hypothetical protein